MMLPNQSTPTYTLTIPSIKKKVQYRPFLVKEQKALLLAQQSGEIPIMITTLKDVIRSCLKTKIDISSLATFDLEYLFMQLRAKSVGEEVDLFVYCDHCDDPEAKAKVTVDLSKIKVHEFPEHSKKIILFDKVGVVMKYPEVELIDKVEALPGNDDINDIFEVVVSCIDYVFDESEIYKVADQPHEDMIKFVANLTSEQFDKIEHFFKTMPRLEQSVTFTCPKCKKEQTKLINGIQTFF